MIAFGGLLSLTSQRLDLEEQQTFFESLTENSSTSVHPLATVYDRWRITEKVDVASEVIEEAAKHVVENEKNNLPKSRTTG